MNGPIALHRLAMFEAGADSCQYLPQLETGLGQIMQLLLIGALLLLHVGNGFAQFLGGGQLLFG